MLLFECGNGLIAAEQELHVPIVPVLVEAYAQTFE